MGSATSEELLENDFHDKQGQKRHQHAPPHAENRALVLLFEVALDEFLEEEFMLPEGLDHRSVTALHLDYGQNRP